MSLKANQVIGFSLKKEVGQGGREVVGKKPQNPKKTLSETYLVLCTNKVNRKSVEPRKKAGMGQQ